MILRPSLSGSVVVFIVNRIEMLMAVARQVRALWQVQPHQSIHVIVEALLPRAVRA